MKASLKQSFATDGIKVVTTGEQKTLLKKADRLGRKSWAKKPRYFTAQAVFFMPCEEVKEVKKVAKDDAYQGYCLYIRCLTKLGEFGLVNTSKIHNKCGKNIPIFSAKDRL